MDGRILDDLERLLTHGSLYGAASGARARQRAAGSLRPPLNLVQTLGSDQASSSPSMAKTGPESWPLASTSRSTNSMTAIAALSP
ncbi:hypothetical protein D3C77_167460 [compost metagenome]